jgi:hypothetical protein
VNGDGEEIIDEITKGGLPSNVRVEIIREAGDVVLEAPKVCGQNYRLGSQVFPEKCSLPVGHKPRSSTANHFCFGIGWWA